MPAQNSSQPTQSQPPAAGAQSKHTPTPWQQLNDNRIYTCYPFAGDKDDCSLIATVPDTQKGDVNAAFIVTACNSHAQLTADVKRLREALAKVEARLTATARAFYVSGKRSDLQTALEGWKADAESARALLSEIGGGK